MRFPCHVAVLVGHRLNAQVVPDAGLFGLRVHNGGLLVKRRRYVVIGLGNGFDFPALMRGAVFVLRVPVVGRHRNAVGLFRLTIQRRDGKGIAVGQVAHRAVGLGVLVHRGPLHRKAAQLQRGRTAIALKLGVAVQVDLLRVNGIAKRAFRFGSVHGGVQRDGRQLCLCGILLQEVEPVRRCRAVGGHNAHRGQQVLFCMVGRQRKAVAVGHKGIAGGGVVGAGAPAHRAAVLRDDQLGVAAVQHLVQFFGQLLLGLVLGLPGGGILPSPGQIGNCIVIVLVAEDIAGKVDIALCGCVQRHVELEVVQERLLIRAVGRKAAGRNLGRSGAADDGLGLAQRAVRAVKAGIVISLAAGNDAEAHLGVLILLQIQRQAADVARGGQRQHSFVIGIDDAQVIVVNARVVGRRPADRVEQGIRVVGLAVDAGDGARRADAGQALLNAVIRHSGRADFIGVGCRHTGDLEPDLVIAPAVAAVGQHGIHVDRQGKAVAILCRRQGVLQRNLLLTGHIAVLVRQQAVELDAVGRRFRTYVLLRPVERIGQLVGFLVNFSFGVFVQRRGFQDIQVQLLEDDLRGRLRGLFCPPTLITVHVGEAERRQMGIGIAVLARANDLIAVLPPDFFVGVVCLVRMAGDGCGHFLRRGIPACGHIAFTAGDGHRNDKEVGVVGHSIRRQTVQVEGDGCLGDDALPRGQRDVLAVQGLPVDRVIAQIFCQQHDAVGRAAVGRVCQRWREAESHRCGKVFRRLAGAGHVLCRVFCFGQRARRQTVFILLGIFFVNITPLGWDVGFDLVLRRA